MKKLTLLLILATICISTANAQLNFTYNQRLNEVFDSVCNKYNIKGASAAIYVPGEGIWERAHGVSHEYLPITKRSLLGIGSNTKTYTAVTLLLLQEKGILDLDDTIGKWIAPHPHISGQITIRQLLNHTSGLYSFTDNADINKMMTDFTRIWPADSTLNLVKAPNAAPGGNWDYSNTNYTLAGLIIREATGKPTHKVIRDELLTPHGLNETYYFPDEMPPAGSIPHGWSNVLSPGNHMEDLIVAHNYSYNAFFSIANAAGAIVATAKDNAIFWHKLSAGKILNAASMKELETVVPLPSSLYKSYGLGIFQNRAYNGRTVISHGGTNYGFINENIADKTNNLSITVLTNQDSISNNILENNVIRALHKVTIRYTDVNEAKFQKGDIKVYPNPAKNILNIKTGNIKNGTIKLYDISGRTIHEQGLVQGDNQININSFSSGTYFVSISDTHQLLHRQTLQIVK